MTIGLQDLAAGIGTAGTATPDDVLALRRAVWADGVISPDEAAVIFALNARLADPGREWVDFFVEALSVWLVDEQEPRGYVDDAQAHWVLGQIAAGGPTATPAELEMLAHVMEKAISTPEALRSYTLDQLEKGVIAAGRVTANEVKILRRVLFAASNDRPAGVSQREAEMLFRIKDATLGGDNAPEWKMLFVQGVANCIQGCGGLSAVFAPATSREVALDRFIASPGPFALGEAARIRAGGIKGQFSDAIDLVRNRHDHFGQDLQDAARAAAEVTPEENAWLKRQVEADGHIDAYEQALYDFLQQP